MFEIIFSIQINANLIRWSQRLFAYKGKEMMMEHIKKSA